MAATQGGLNFYQLDRNLQIQTSIADSECVTTLQLLEKLIETARSLENLNETYPIQSKKLVPPKKLVLPEAAKEAMNKLREIAEPIICNMRQSSYFSQVT